jgi:hypothetical protein
MHPPRILSTLLGAMMMLLFLADCKTADTKVGLTTNEGPRVKETISDPELTR